ncbi:hypothetical protein Goarm_023147 [Gossypium armourianum]|uniref:Uncharacterized protein n=1 Tax=Gossypium armourianum TaxID=34283 RepID=A0A7J9KGN9_9ROSI|nr:hypothetical protein [Gossypium armourianum]
MHLLKKFVGFDLSTSGYEEKSQRLRLEYLRPLLKGRKYLLLSILREPLSVERIRGYAKAR